MRQLYYRFLHPFFSGSYKVFKAVLLIIAAITVTSSTAFFIIYYFFARDLPDIASLDDYHPPVVSEVFAKDGTRIGEFWTECRFFTPYEKIPKLLVQAFLDSEDDRFFEHKGVDTKAIFRAFIANMKSRGVSQGGSTITQQITRSLLLSRERSFRRKIREAILATRLERRLSKVQILTLYLNQIYLGNRAYGVAAAARNYFHKSLDELTPAEMALIAGLPTAPTNYSPVVNPAAARKRQLHVLQRLYVNHHITKSELQTATDTPLVIYVAGTDKEFTDPDAAYFVEHVRRLVKERYGDEALYKKGLKISTTVALAKQKAAATSVLNGVIALDRRQGYRGIKGHVSAQEIPDELHRLDKTLKHVDTKGYLLWPPGRAEKTDDPKFTFAEGKLYSAVVTGFEGKNVRIGIGSFEAVIPPQGYKWARRFNPNLEGYDDAAYVRDPSTLLKIGDIIDVRKHADGSFHLSQELKLQGALFSLSPQNGHVEAMMGGVDFSKSEFNRATQSLRQPGSSFKPFVYAAALDKGYTFDSIVNDSPATYHVGVGEVWTPKNYDDEYKGPIRFQDALVHSRNVPTVKIAYDIGTHYITGFVRKLGLTSPIYKYLSMALGANGVYLSEMVQAYSVFVNKGVLQPVVYITKIEDAKGNILEERSEKTTAEFLANPGTKASTPQQNDDAKLSDATKRATRKVKESDLNSELFAREQQTLKQDQLILTDLELKTLYGSRIPPGHVITPQTAHLMVEALRQVVERGTGTRVKQLERPAAGKTGTTNDESDTWFIGFVPDLVTGVWLGFDEMKPLGKKETGGKTAAPVFISYMKEALKASETQDFTPPEAFPVKAMASLPGGSALFGGHSRIGHGSEPGAERAGDFFAEDLDQAKGGTPPPAKEKSPTSKFFDGEY